MQRKGPSQPTVGAAPGEFEDAVGADSAAAAALSAMISAGRASWSPGTESLAAGFAKVRTADHELMEEPS